VSGPFHGGSEAPAVAAVVVSFEARAPLLSCLASLRAHVRLPLDVVVVDNASGDGSSAAVRSAFPEASVLANAENLGFARACNQGLFATRAPRVLFLNPDARVEDGAVEALATHLERRTDVGVVGPRTVFPDGTPQVSTGAFLTPLSEWSQRRLVRGVRRRSPAALREAERRHAREYEPDWVSGSCMLARREALVAVGGWDEGYFLYEEDVDLCLRLRRAGWRAAFAPDAVVVHVLGASARAAPARSRLEYHRSHLRYYRLHNGPWASALLRAYLAVLGVRQAVRPCPHEPKALELLRLAASAHPCYRTGATS
jgi:N-acetylglucosaminyl-diphospho-decaprenol L-rhamnosyltransferase